MKTFLSPIRGWAVIGTLCLFHQGQAIIVNIQIIQHEICSYANGTAQAMVSGGVPPYTYIWSNGATTPSISGLSAGIISVTVTDSQSDEASANRTVNSVGYQYVATSGGSMCPGDQYDGYLFFGGVPDYGPVTFSTPYYTGMYFGEPVYSAFYNGPAGYNPIALEFTDANGCAGVLTNVYRLGQPTWTTPVILDVQGACATGSNGSFQALLQHSPTYARTWHLLTDGAGTVFGPNGTIITGNASTYGYIGTELYDVVQTWEGLAAGEYWLKQVTNFAPFTEWQPGGGCGDSVMITIPDLGGGCANVSGTVFMDYDEDCSKTFNEPARPGALLQFDPGPYFATTNGGGRYSLNVPAGSYTVTELANSVQQHCVPEPIIVDATGLVVLDLADTSLVPLDVQLTMASGAARPGFEVRYAIDLDNLTPANSGGNQVTMSFDPLLGYVAGSPAPSSTGTGTLTWNNVGALSAFDQRGITVRFQVPSDVGLIGTVLNASANVVCGNTDGFLTNNTFAHSVTITGAYDPNDKIATTGAGRSASQWLIDEDEWIDYTIRFQNTGSDTAFLVVITDTLPANLDPATITVGAASHNFNWELRDSGTLKFIFPNILLPDSNINEPLSHGFVGFRIRPRLPLLPGETIENTANIFFDFNPPVITEPSVLVAEFSTSVQEPMHEQGKVRLSPNPANDLVRVSADGTIETITMLTADGREVMRRSVRSSIGTLDVSWLSSGTYVLLAVMADGTFVHSKFVKY